MFQQEQVYKLAGIPSDLFFALSSLSSTHLGSQQDDNGTTMADAHSKYTSATLVVVH
jgi:hypothetical protein